MWFCQGTPTADIHVNGGLAKLSLGKINYRETPNV